MIDPRIAWFAMGATCSAVVFGWPWHPRFSRYNRMGPPRGSYGPRLDPGIVQRGNGHGGPTTAKPRIIPRGANSISFPDPVPDRQPTNPFTGDPVKPQPSGGRLITEGEWRAEWASIDDDGSFSLGLVRDHNPNPPPTDP